MACVTVHGVAGARLPASCSLETQTLTFLASLTRTPSSSRSEIDGAGIAGALEEPWKIS